MLVRVTDHGLGVRGRHLQPRRRCAHTRSLFSSGSNDFKVGLTIEFEDAVWKVQEFLHVKPGKGSAFVRSKLKNLQTGSTLEKTWRQAEQSFPDAQVDKESMTFSYIDGDDHVFMNMNTFEEERIKSADIDKRDFEGGGHDRRALLEGHRDRRANPKTVALKVVEAAPGAKGNTAQGRAEKPSLRDGRAD